jgi:carbamoyl-phosphate synthase large subunit
MTCLKDCKNLKKVIFASSYLIYDPSIYYSQNIPEKSTRIKETDPIYPRNTCGGAKLFHEIEIRFLENFEQVKFQTVSARIFRVYGKNSKDIISRWIRALLNNETIEVYNQENYFDYIYSEDVADGLIFLATSAASGVVNLGNDNSRTITNVLQILKKYFPQMKVELSGTKLPYEASQANMDWFKHLTNWNPQKQLEDAIPEIIEFEKEQNSNENSHKDGLNILVTSISKKVPLLKSLKKAKAKLNEIDQVIGADSNNNCIGKFFVDQFWNMPLIEQLELKEFIEYCKQKKIFCVIPTRDGELSYFAKNRDIFLNNNIHVMISDSKAVKACLDKLEFFEEGKKLSFPVIQTTKKIEELDCSSYVVKERYGAGSRKIRLNLKKEEAVSHGNSLDNPIFQPFIKGKEFSVDLYVGKDGKTKGAITRTRELIVDGESQITETVQNPELETMCSQFVEKLNLYGHSVMQVIIDSEGNLNIIECNNRFGGASSLSQEVGLDSFFWFLLESLGGNLDDYSFTRSSSDKKQIRHAEDLIVY